MMEDEKIKKVIKKEFNIDDNIIIPTALLKDDLGLSSLDLVKLIISLEEIFSISIPDEGLDDILSVHDIISYVKGIINEKT